MKKTICDICGKDMPLDIVRVPIKNLNFCISSNGKIWDICNKCRGELDEWIKEHKAVMDGSEVVYVAESEDEE